MQITLLRHGKPAFELSGSARARDLPGIAESYNQSGITGTPPGDAVDIVRHHKVVVCSDLPRSLQSAKTLGITQVHTVDAMFRETGIPHFSNGALRLPLGAWVIVLRSLWFLGFSKNGEPLTAARQRARRAAQHLIDLADEYGTVLVVGHGFINYFIAKELLANDWRGPARPGSGHWQYGIYRKRPGAAP